MKSIKFQATILLTALIIATTITDTQARRRPESIRVLYPNGEEKIPIGSTYQIRWSANDIDRVTIQLLDVKRTVGTIARNIQADTSHYNWKVGAILKDKVKPGDNYKIVITASGQILNDESDQYFSITSADSRKKIAPLKPMTPSIRKIRPPVTAETDQQEETDEQEKLPIEITSPKQYEGWATDMQHTIAWDTTLPADTNVKIEIVQTDASGTNVFNTVTANTPNTGTYTWQGIPASQYNSVSRNLKVRISTLDDSYTALSDLFTFGKPLYLQQPKTPVTWRKGSTVSIMWEVVSQLPEPLSIDLLDSNHQQTLNIAGGLSPTPKASTNKSFLRQWTIPASLDPGSYFVQVSSGNISKEQAIKIDEPIVFPKSPHITITNPKAFDGWATDTEHTINWNSTLPASDPNVKIELVQTGASGIIVWKTLAASTPNTGTYTWSGIPSAQYNSVSRTVMVRISTLDDSEVTVGDVFTFGKQFYFQEPAAAYTWKKGSTGTIMWEMVSELPEAPSIDLLDSNHQQVLNIASGLNKIPRASTNKRQVYRWTVPTNLDSGSYFIRISSGSISEEKPINIAD
jgi:hypothetical protein